MAAAFDIWPSFCNLKQQKYKFVTSYLYIQNSGIDMEEPD